MQTIPNPIRSLLAIPALSFLARLALASPFLVSGIMKLVDLEGAVAEMAGVGLSPAGVFAFAVIATQIGGSLLLLTRRWCWLGAGLLAGFTALATLIAHPFWTFEGMDRIRQMMTFLEHVAIAGGLLSAALLLNGVGKDR
jgi:transmembrane protein